LKNEITSLDWGGPDDGFGELGSFNLCAGLGQMMDRVNQVTSICVLQSAFHKHLMTYGCKKKL
jgi:hypothetical protein